MTTIRTTARIASIFAAAALVAGASAPAFAEPEVKPATTATIPAPKGPTRYCTEPQARTGSLLPTRKVCKTRSDWIALTGIDPATLPRK